jgi:hypothetical protein
MGGTRRTENVVLGRDGALEPGDEGVARRARAGVRLGDHVLVHRLSLGERPDPVLGGERDGNIVLVAVVGRFDDGRSKGVVGRDEDRAARVRAGKEKQAWSA